MIAWTLLVSNGLALMPREPIPPGEVIITPLPDTPFTGHTLTVKFTDDARARAALDGTLHLMGAPGEDRRALDALIAAHGLHFSPAIQISAKRLDLFEARAAQRSGRAQPDLAGILHVSSSVTTPEEMAELGAALQVLPLIEYATLSVFGTKPPVDIAPTTPDYTNLQTYAGPDPGIDAEFAYDLGIFGQTIQLSDCEYGWDHTHEDLSDRSLNREPDQTPADFVFDNGWDAHGTAVVGIIGGVDNSYGVTGLAPEAAVYTWPEYTIEDGTRRYTAITNAIAASTEGDVVLLEMQSPYGSGRFGPAEADPTVWAIVRAGADAGVVVVGAAGNGAADLDSGWYADNYIPRGDSGAIIVGSGSPDTRHAPLPSSTHGERVDLQGWGQGVFSLGYGDFAQLDDDPRQAYTSNFSGTSSASAIVAGAVVLVQDYMRSEWGEPLAPEAMRALLRETGTPQGSGAPVGPLPNVQAAIRAIDDDQDGYRDAAWGGTDCDDDSNLAFPGGDEITYDGLDNDCDPRTIDDDLDADGFDLVDDCDDEDGTIHPNAEEDLNNNRDDNCNGRIDEIREPSGGCAVAPGPRPGGVLILGALGLLWRRRR
ncbi:MAG: S8 family serine peptidase [Myxococcota bacterium]